MQHMQQNQDSQNNCEMLKEIKVWRIISKLSHLEAQQWIST